MAFRTGANPVMSTRTHARCARFVRAAIWFLTLGWAWLGPPPASAQLSSSTVAVQETSTSVSYSGAWVYEDTRRSWSGGTAAMSTTAAARATFTFTGIGVSWIGFRGPQAGIARVFLDGALAATIDLFAPAEQVQAVVFAATDLTDASHTLAVEVTGEKDALSSGNLVVVDAFEITAGAAGLVDTTPPTVTITSPYAGAAVPTGLILRARASDDFAVTGVRFFVDGVAIGNKLVIAPYWVAWDTSTVAEGPHTLTVVAHDAAGNTGSADIPVAVDRTPPAVAVTSPANGTTVSGMVTISADVSDKVGVDPVWFSANGVSLGEDATPPYEIVWDTTLIPDGSYTLKVAARDQAGGLNSTEVTVTVWNGTTRIQETDPAITYSGTWAHGNEGVRAWSGGTAAIATLTAYPAQATLSFDGTGVSWIGFRGPQAGIANVYLDGVQVATVDLFDPVEHVQAVVYHVSGLAPGPHTLIVEATGTWNPLSTDPFVVVDAFIVFER